MSVRLRERSSAAGVLPGREENGEILEDEIVNVKAKSSHGWDMMGFWTWVEVSAFYADRPLLPPPGEGRQCIWGLWCST